jgi:hypothetical protein
MKKKYIKDLESLYSEKVLNESIAVGEDITKLNTADGIAPEKSGADGIEGLVKPLDSKAAPNDITDNVTQKSERSEKEEKKHENLYEADINNCTMSTSNNIFDKLYATIMEADDLDDENIGFDALEDEEGDLDELGIDDEGSEVTITLTADEADLLKSIVGKLGGDEEDDLEDLDDGDDDLDFGSEDPLMEDGEAKDLPDAVGKMTSKGNMKVKGKASQNTGAGNATSSAPKGGDGKPSNLADGVPRMTKKTAKADANLKHIGD